MGYQSPKAVRQLKIVKTAKHDPIIAYLADPLRCEAYYVVQHFGADEDIRHQDPQYAEWQVNGLKGLVQRLKAKGET